MPQMLFEIGPVFVFDGKKIAEGKRIGIVGEHSRANFSEIKSVVESVLRSMGIESFSLAAKDVNGFLKGRCAAILVGGKQIGCLGEMRPQVLENFRIEEPVFAAEIIL